MSDGNDDNSTPASNIVPFIGSSNGAGEAKVDLAVPVAYDLDGRRRVVFTKDEQRKIDHVLQLLVKAGFGIAVGCFTRPDKTKPCGQVLINEGKGTPDSGYGCQCQRIHFGA